MAYYDSGLDFLLLLGGDRSPNPYINIAETLITAEAEAITIPSPATIEEFVITPAGVVPGRRPYVSADYDFTQENRKGVFATYPASSPKYRNTNNDLSLETMARLMVPLADKDVLNRYLASFQKGTETRKLVEAVATLGGEAETGSKSYGLGYIDFLLQSAQESYQEKVQVVDVLSDNFVAYYFGAQPPVFNYSGTLLNTRQDDWRAAFTILYNDVIRGTELARRRAVVTLVYDDMAVTGTIMGMSQILTANRQLASDFSFQMLVHRIDVDRTIGHPVTKVKTFPAFVTPSAFATKQFEVPPKTIRAVGTPGFTTVNRKKEEEEESRDRVTIDLTTTSDDTYGGTIADPSESTNDFLNGGGMTLLEENG